MLMLILGLLLQVVPPGQDPNTPAAADQAPGQNKFVEIQKKALRLAEAAKKLGNWNEHAELSRTAVEKVFQRAGWDTPEDLFAFELFRAVDSQPPWAYMQRAETFFGLLGKRYNLNDEQRQHLVELVVREATGLFAEHADTILTYSTEMIEARAAGKPFTPEQVARWTKMSEPIMTSGHRRIVEASEAFMDDLSPEQQSLVHADLRAANRRIGGVQEMMREWKEGRWEAADWGMEEDPIQTGKLAAERESQALEREAAGTPPPASAPERVVPPQAEKPSDPTHPPDVQPDPQPDNATPERSAQRPPVKPPTRTAIDADPWARYVQAFIDKYKLEEAQRQKAWLYYEQTHERIVQAGERFAPAKDKGAEKKSDVSRLTSELERAFAQLKLRLERLPTRTQRREATPGEIPSPIPAEPQRGPASRPGSGK